jgi:hypothetical protein
MMYWVMDVESTSPFFNAWGVSLSCVILNVIKSTKCYKGSFGMLNCRLLTMAEGRLAHSDSRAHENDVEASSLRDQLAGAMDGLRGLSLEHEKLKAEVRAAHDDLEALVS